jgi:thioredoxin 1
MVKIIESADEIPRSGVVVVDFFANWCRPCKGISPHFEQLAKAFTTVTFLKVDIDESTDLAEAFEVKSLPTFLFFKNGQIVKKLEGADLQGIIQILQALEQ